MRTYVGFAIQTRHIGELLAEAFNLASVVATAVKGFEKTGIWPTYRHVFSDDDVFEISVAINESQPANSASSSQPPPPLQISTPGPNSNSSAGVSSNVQQPLPPEADESQITHYVCELCHYEYFLDVLSDVLIIASFLFFLNVQIRDSRSRCHFVL